MVLKKIKRIDEKEVIIKFQQRFKSKRYNVFTEEINKIVLSSNDDKKILSIDSIETYYQSILLRHTHMNEQRPNMDERKI